MQNSSLGICCEIVTSRMSQNFDEKAILVQVMAFVPSGKKPLPEPMLTQIHITMCYH